MDSKQGPGATKQDERIKVLRGPEKGTERVLIVTTERKGRKQAKRKGEKTMMG